MKNILIILAFSVALSAQASGGGYSTTGSHEEVAKFVIDDGSHESFQITSYRDYGFEFGTVAVSTVIEMPKPGHYVPQVIGKPENQFDLVSSPLHGKRYRWANALC
jgi:hypothetical protein